MIYRVPLSRIAQLLISIDFFFYLTRFVVNDRNKSRDAQGPQILCLVASLQGGFNRDASGRRVANAAFATAVTSRGNARWRKAVRLHQ